MTPTPFVTETLLVTSRAWSVCVTAFPVVTVSRLTRLAAASSSLPLSVP
jgi:hypothetical protein